MTALYKARAHDLGVDERHLHEQLLAAHAERVEGADAHQVLDDLDAHPRALAEVEQRAVGAAALGRALAHDGRGRGAAHLLDVAQADPQRPPVALDREALERSR